MIAEGSDSSEDEGEKGSEDDEKEESSEAVPEEVKEAADKQSLFGLSLPDFGSRAFNERGVPLTWKASSVTTPEITGTEQDKRGESKPEERVFTFPSGRSFTFPVRPDPRKAAPEVKSASRDPDWPALPTGAPTWGNNPKPDWRVLHIPSSP